jgi:hypothetical protein
MPFEVAREQGVTVQGYRAIGYESLRAVPCQLGTLPEKHVPSRYQDLIQRFLAHAM